MRVLKWIVGRCQGTAHAVQTPLGWQPAYEDIDWEGLDVPRRQFDELMKVDTDMWRQELESHGELFAKLQERLPKEFILKRELFQLSLWR
jgi:phosphoenolpyruvate carboxykinase (GTP)